MPQGPFGPPPGPPFPPQGIPPSVPGQSADAPDFSSVRAAPYRTGPYVGNSGPWSLTGNVSGTTFSFGTNVAAGNGIVIFTCCTTSGATFKATDSAGNTYNATPTFTETSNTAVVQALWVAQSKGGNPTVTLTCSASAKVIYWWGEIVGASTGWFLDGLAGMQVSSGLAAPILRSTTPNDLLLIAGVTNDSSNPATAITFPTGIPGTTIFQTWASSGDGALVVGVSKNPLAAYTSTTTSGPGYNPGAGQAALTLLIRAAGQFPSQPPALPPPVVPGLPQGPFIVPLLPYPETLATKVAAPAVIPAQAVTVPPVAVPGVALSPFAPPPPTYYETKTAAATTTAALSQLGVSATTGTGALSGAGALTTLGVTTTIGTATLTGTAALSALAVSETIGTASLNPALQALGSTATTGTAQLTGTVALAALAVTVTEGTGALSGAGALAALGVTVDTGSADLEPAATAGSMAALALTTDVSTASLTGSGALTALGVTPTQAAAQLSGAGALTALGLSVTAATAQLSALIAGVAVSTTTGSASLTGSGALSAVGVAPSVGTAALTGVGALSALGVSVTTGTADLEPLAAAGAMTALGVSVSIGTATLTGSAALQALGVTASQGTADLEQPVIVTPPVTQQGAGAGFARGKPKRYQRAQDEPLAEADPRVEHRGPVMREGQVFGEPDPVSPRLTEGGRVSIVTVDPDATLIAAEAKEVIPKTARVKAKRARKGHAFGVRYVLGEWD